MEGSSTFLADQSSAYSLDDVIAVGFDADDSSKLDSQFMKNGIQGRGLGGGAGESVEDPSLFAVVLGQSFLYDAHSYTIRNKGSLVHIAFSFLAESSSRFHSRTEHVAGCNLGDAVITNELFCLGAFAGAGRSH